MSRPAAIYDANVLYPAQLGDYLMRLGVHEVVRAHWTDQIHEEWTRNVYADYPGIKREDLRRIRRLMEKALSGASVEPRDNVVSTLTLPGPSDRHVLAAAIQAEAGYIVTFNTADFPAEKLARYGVQATRPDQSFLYLLARSPGKIIEGARAHRSSLSHPPKTPANT